MTKRFEVAVDMVIDGHVTCEVDIWYPPRNEPSTQVCVGLVDVRAAGDVTIEFDFKRDGWVIRMDRVAEGDGWVNVLEEKAEVAFLPAWNEE